MNVVCDQSGGIGMVPPLTSHTHCHICCQTSMDLYVSAVVNRAKRRNSSKSTTLKSNKTEKVCRSAKKVGTIIQSNKEFPKTEKLPNL